MLMDMPRTNNGYEGFHNAIKSSITNVHPNLWTLIGALKKEEVEDRIKNVFESVDNNKKVELLQSLALNMKYI